MSKFHRAASLPLDRQLCYGTGLQYEWSEDIILGIAYEFVDMGDAELNQARGPLSGTLQGDYSTNHINFINANLIWKF